MSSFAAAGLTVLVWLLQVGPAGAEGVTFDIYEYQVEGNTALPRTAVEKAVYEFLGPARTIEDVEKARAALEKAYRSAGFSTVIVSIPEQQVTEGVVKLQVTEGRIGRVQVTGNRYYSAGYIRAQAPSIREGAVANFPAIQKDVATLNSSPERRVLPILRPGTRLGTTDFELQVQEQRPFKANVELNNYYSPNTTELRLLAGVGYDNLWQRGHSIGMQVQTSPQDTSEVRVFSASYFAPLRGDATGAAYYIKSNSNVAAVGDLTVLGNGEIFGLRWMQPVRGEASYSQSLAFGADYKSFNNVVVQPGTAGIPTPIHYTDLVVSYTGTFVKPTYSTTFSTGLTFSVRGISASDSQFEENRFNATSNFAIWKWDIQHTRAMYRGWSVFGRFDGQLTGQPLVSTEQYAAGGADNVRGYLQAEAIGDNAVHATLELRTPSVGARLSPKIQDLTAYAFLDGAELNTIDALPGQHAHSTLVSTGLGLRARALDTLSLRLDVGVALKPTIYTAEGEARVQFSVAYRN